jgi:iron complex outermembrane recepter protein
MKAHSVTKLGIRICLQPENSLQFDFALGVNSTHVSSELDLFYNHVNNFIFIQRSEDQSVSGSDNLPVFRFNDGNAQFYGGEFRLDIHPHPWDWMHLGNTFSYVRATLENQPSESHNLPFIPAPVWISDIKIEIKNRCNLLKNSYVKFGMSNTWKQNHIYSAYETETKTPGYTLLNMG